MDRFNSNATFADWLREKLLCSTEGWYVDAAVTCLKNFVIAENYDFATALVVGTMPFKSQKYVVTSEVLCPIDLTEPPFEIKLLFVRFINKKPSN